MLTKIYLVENQMSLYVRQFTSESRTFGESKYVDVLGFYSDGTVIWESFDSGILDNLDDFAVSFSRDKLYEYQSHDRDLYYLGPPETLTYAQPSGKYVIDFDSDKTSISFSIARHQENSSYCWDYTGEIISPGKLMLSATRGQTYRFLNEYFKFIGFIKDKVFVPAEQM